MFPWQHLKKEDWSHHVLWEFLKWCIHWTDPVSVHFRISAQMFFTNQENLRCQGNKLMKIQQYTHAAAYMQRLDFSRLLKLPSGGHVSIFFFGQVHSILFLLHRM